MTEKDYYREFLAEACDCAGLEAANWQIGLIVDDLMVAIEQQGMAFGSHAIPNPLQSKLDQEKVDRQREHDDMQQTINHMVHRRARQIGCNASDLFIDIRGEFRYRGSLAIAE